MLVEAFREGDDFHERTALKIFGADSGRDPHELRSIAKMVNYALLYGKTAFTLAKDIGVTPQAAQEFIDAYFAGFPRVRAFIDRTLEEARATGVVKTMYGRRRLVPELNSRDVQRRVGGGARGGQHADSGHGRRHPEARDDRRPRGARCRIPSARMILTVHDELLFEVPKARAEEVAEIVRERDAGRGGAERAADGRRRHRRELERREAVEQRSADSADRSIFVVQRLLELLPLRRAASSGGCAVALRAVGDDARAARGDRDRRAAPRRGRPPAARGPSRPAPRPTPPADRPAPRAAAASQYAAAPLAGMRRQLLVHARRGCADRPPAGRSPGAACASRSSALAHQSSTRSRASPVSRSRLAQRSDRTRRRRRRTRRRRYSASPRPTTYSVRSRGGKRCGSSRRSRSRALARSSAAALARKRSRYARAATRSAASARAGVRRAWSAASIAASNCPWL